MPFSTDTKNPGDLIKSQDWNEAMNAIVALFDKLDQSTGHQHTGGVEDAPPIPEAGLEDNTVSADKIQDAAVTETKIASGAVTSDKIANNSINAAKIAANAVGSSEIASSAVGSTEISNNAVSNAKLANNAVTTAKIANGAVTAAKIAPGVIEPAVGVAMTRGLTNDQLIPVPSGFDRSECIYYVTMKWLNIDLSVSAQYFSNVDSNGKISIGPEDRVVCMGLALGKKGGW